MLIIYFSYTTYQYHAAIFGKHGIAWFQPVIQEQDFQTDNLFHSFNISVLSPHHAVLGTLLFSATHQMSSGCRHSFGPD